MRQLIGRHLFRRTLSAGLGATASVLLAGCVVGNYTPELCDAGKSQRSVKCPPQSGASHDAAGYSRGSDY